MLKTDFEEQWKKLQEDEEKAERDRERLRPLVNAVAGIGVILVMIVAFAAVTAVVGGAWWVLTGKPMFGG